MMLHNMMMKLILGISLTATVATAHAGGASHSHGHPHHDGGMKHHGHEEAFRDLPVSHALFHDIETACARDVREFCEVHQERRPQSSGDPFVDWLFFPFAPPPPEIQDIHMMMDRLFDPLFMEPTREHVTLFFIQEPEHAPQFIIDSAAAKAAKGSEPEEIPKLAADLQLYGNQMLEKIGEDESSFQFKMARRLTELDSRMIQHQVHLPFGCTKNHCLRRALEAGKVSSDCRSSIERLEAVFALEHYHSQQEALSTAMLGLYFAIIAVICVMARYKGKILRRNRRLNMRILHAVYQNPQLKRQIQLDLGQSIGNAVRVPHGRGAMKGPRFALFSFLLALVIFAPHMILPFCILLALGRMVRLCLLPATSEADCTCCCCGATAAQARNGELTDAQACCGCCKGTGTCSAACASCCGNGGCCCCCGGKGCSCCTMKASTMKDDCTCCCCGATTAQARNGELTDAQACCGCCKGTGTCSAACASCCGNGCSCNNSKVLGEGQKHVMPVKNEVYCGIPLQIV